MLAVTHSAGGPGRVSPRDPALPILDALLPPEGSPSVVAAFLAEATGTDVAPQAGRVDHVRYSPGESCLILWSFPRATGGREFVASWAVATGTGGSPLETPRAKRAVAAVEEIAPAEGKLFRYLAEHGLLLQRLPFDVELPGLLGATNETWLRDRVAPVLGGNWQRARAEAVHYKPGSRCIYRYDVKMATDERAYYGKFYRGKTGAQQFQVVGAIAEHLQHLGAPWLVPRPRHYFPGTRGLFFDAISITDGLSSRLRSNGAGGPLAADVARVAEGLAAFRSAPVDDLRPRQPADLIASFGRDQTAMSATMSVDAARSVGSAISQLERLAHALPPERNVISHGAFRLEQVVKSGEALFVLDLDTICRAGVSADPGTFLGYLDVAALRLPSRSTAIGEIGDIFRSTVLRAGEADEDWLEWHRRAVHVRKALQVYRGLHANADPVVASLTELSDG